MVRLYFTILLSAICSLVAWSQAITVDRNGTGQWDLGGSFDPTGEPTSSNTLSWANNSVGTIFLTGDGPTVDTDTICNGTLYKCGFVGAFTNNKNGGILNLDYSRIIVSGDYTINNAFTLNLNNHGQFVITGNLTVSNNASFSFGANCENCVLEVQGNLIGDNGSSIDLQGGGTVIVGNDVDLGTGTNITIDADSQLEVGNDFTVDGGTVTVQPCTTGCTENGYLSIGGTVTDNGSIEGGGSVYTPNDPTFTCPTGTTCETEPLPIVLSSFTGFGQDAIVALQWKTNSEQNFHYFQLNKIIDAEIQDLGIIYSSGSSSGDSYSWHDENPSIGQNIYQLKSVDYDGYEELFPAISVIYDPSDIDLGFYPNPTTSANLKTYISDSFHLEVYSISGEKLFDQRVESFNQEKLPLLKPGLYLFKSNINGLFKTQRVMIN